MRVTCYIFSLTILLCTSSNDGYNVYTRDDLLQFREEVRAMFYHGYENYLTFAYPYDELRPLTCDGVDTWGSYSLTLIDALDTLIIMGNYTEFKRVSELIVKNIQFDMDINVSVFETTIRIIGGLLSAHILSHKAQFDLPPGWPCDGPLLRLATDVADRILPAFDTITGMPFGTVNLKNGVPMGETTITCTAGIGTFILEFGTLSRLTGNPVYEKFAMNALEELFRQQSKIGLLGNHIDIMTGRWTSQDSGIGAGIDSYFEYLVKGSLLFDNSRLMSMFLKLEKSVNKYLKFDNWFFWVSMQKGLVTLPLFQSLEAYWPGLLSLVGNMNQSMKMLHNYHMVWKKYGFTPEFYNILKHEVSVNRESYPLRPELIESVMYLYRATGDPFLLDVGVAILKSIKHSAFTKCGYATVKNCRDHSLENRMESFFLAETTKYLYLLFDPDNFIHNLGQHGKVINGKNGKCIIDAGGYIFNTEAHPIDPGIIHCCTTVPATITDKLQPETDALLRAKNVDTLKQIVDRFKHSVESDTSSSKKAIPMVEKLQAFVQNIDNKSNNFVHDPKNNDNDNRLNKKIHKLRLNVCTRREYIEMLLLFRDICYDNSLKKNHNANARHGFTEGTELSKKIHTDVVARLQRLSKKYADEQKLMLALRELSNPVTNQPAYSAAEFNESEEQVIVEPNVERIDAKLKILKRVSKVLERLHDKVNHKVGFDHSNNFDSDDLMIEENNNLLYCKYQPYIQRLASFGQTFNATEFGSDNV